MKANIFIAWGGNKKLADFVAKELISNREYYAQVGGDSQEDIYISSQIVGQIMRSSNAIILVQNACKEGNKIDLRPNLMFEWGYIIAKLNPKNIHMFLIDLQAKDLPSDLAGAWVEEINTLNKSIEDIAKQIANLFNKNFKESYPSKLQIMNHWKTNNRIIANHCNDPVYTEREMAHLILHSIQPAYYYNELDILIDSIKKIYTQDKILKKVKELAINVAQFYITTDNQLVKSSFNEFDKIIEKLEIDYTSDDEDDINYWINIIKYDFIGLCYKFMAETDEIECTQEMDNYYQLAFESFQKAINIMKKNKIEKTIDKEYIDLWCGYIYHNLAIICSNLKDKEKAEEYFHLAREARRNIWNYFSANTNNTYLINNLELEYCLVRVEEMKYLNISKTKKHRYFKSINADLKKLGKKYSKQYVLLEYVKKEFTMVNENK